MTSERRQGALNVRTVAPGSTVLLTDGRKMRVNENPMDGYWLACLELPTEGASPSEDEEMIFFNEIAQVIEEGTWPEKG